MRSVRILIRSRRPSIGDPLGNIRSRRAALFDQAERLEFAIGPRHGVGIDDQPIGQDANGRKFVLRLEPARGDQILDLVDDLQIDRHAVIGRDVDLHGSVREQKLAAACMLVLTQ